MSAKQIGKAAQNCRLNAEKLRAMARVEADNNVRKLLLEAAHHLEVGAAELGYITTNSTGFNLTEGCQVGTVVFFHSHA